MKKKLLVSLFVALGMYSYSSAEILGLVDDSTKSKIENLPIIKKQGNMKIETARFNGDLYVVNFKIDKGERSQNLVLYVTKNFKNIISGNALNSKTGQPLLIPKDVSVLKEKEDFTYGTGDKVFYLFTDPECPYCKEFEKHLPQIKDKIKVKFFFYPLNFHENAEEMSKYIMSQKNKKFEKLLNIEKEDYKSAKYPQAIEKKLQEHKEFASKLGVKGTPSILDEDGRAVSWINLLSSYGININAK